MYYVEIIVQEKKPWGAIHKWYDAHAQLYWGGIMKTIKVPRVLLDN